MIYAEAEMSTFPLLPAGSMYGWLGQALTIVSLPSPTSIRSPETYIPPQVKAILRWEDPTMTTNNMSKTKLVVFKSQNPPPTQLAPLLSIG